MSKQATDLREKAARLSRLPQSPERARQIAAALRSAEAIEAAELQAQTARQQQAEFNTVRKLVRRRMGIPSRLSGIAGSLANLIVDLGAMRVTQEIRT